MYDDEFPVCEILKSERDAATEFRADIGGIRGAGMRVAQTSTRARGATEHIMDSDGGETRDCNPVERTVNPKINIIRYE